MKAPERLHSVQKNDQKVPQQMSDLERLALAVGVWVVLTCTVFLLGWLEWA